MIFLNLGLTHCLISNSISFSYDEALATVRSKRSAPLASNETEWISEELAAMDTNGDGVIEPGEFDKSLK
jgi:hypothetical protein